MNARFRRTTTALAAVTTAVLLAVPATSAFAKGPGGGGGGGGGGDTSVGNNLSAPLVVTGEAGVSPVLRGTPGVMQLEGAYVTLGDGSRAYLQQDALNNWQAQVVTSPVTVSAINWGDNLESKDWALRQVVRVETQLFAAAEMTGFEMVQTSTTSGKTEMWGLVATDLDGDGAYAGVPKAFTRAFVYSGAARLTIQRVDPTKELVWNPDTAEWTGAGAGTVVVKVATANTADGPGGYAGETSVGGNFVYGYVWNTRNAAAGAGEYRLTYSLGGFPLTTSFEGAVIDTPGTANIAHIDAANHMSYIDVALTTTKGSGGRK